MLDRVLQSRLLRFALVGGFATGLQLLLLVLLVELAQLPEMPASALAFLLSAVANYLLNYHLTFASRQRHLHTLPRFVLVAMLGVAFNTYSFSLLLPLLHYLVAQLLATLITLTINFLLNKHWIYRSLAL